jgi:hypothetical protein
VDWIRDRGLTLVLMTMFAVFPVHAAHDETGH